MGRPDREHQNRSSGVVLLQLSNHIRCKVTKAAVVIHKALKALHHDITLLIPQTAARSTVSKKIWDFKSLKKKKKEVGKTGHNTARLLAIMPGNPPKGELPCEHALQNKQLPSASSKQVAVKFTAKLLSPCISDGYQRAAKVVGKSSVSTLMLIHDFSCR